MEFEYGKLVTVVIPTYGRPIALKRAIDSVLKQTYANSEIIVVDDNDPTSENRRLTEGTMEEYIQNSRVKYIRHKKNMNGYNARNTGISAANGVYITFLDDDDEMLPERIEKLVDKMESLDPSWCACYSNFVKKKSGNVEIYGGENREGYLYLEALMRSLYFCPGSNLFARTDSVRKINGFDGDFPRNQDLEFLARLLENGKLAYVDELLLIIHCEDRKLKQTNYEKIIALNQLYLDKFSSRIEALFPKDRKKVYQYFALDRLRYAILTHNTMDGLRNCRKNKVSIVLLFRYCFYCIGRLLNKKSYGFKI